MAVLGGIMKKNLILIFAFLLIVSCQSAPDKENYKDALSFMIADCLYRAQKNPVVCDKIVERYRDWHKENSFKDKLEYCRNPINLFEGWDFEKCRLYLNQK